jgi:hypothetical protein
MSYLPILDEPLFEVEVGNSEIFVFLRHTLIQAVFSSSPIRARLHLEEMRPDLTNEHVTVTSQKNLSMASVKTFLSSAEVSSLTESFCATFISPRQGREKGTHSLRRSGSRVFRADKKDYSNKIVSISSSSSHYS